MAKVYGVDSISDPPRARVIRALLAMKLQWVVRVAHAANPKLHTWVPVSYSVFLVFFNIAVLVQQNGLLLHSL